MRNKYGAVKTTVDGIVFASKKEAKRYGELMLLLKAGKIGGLRLQPRYPLVVNGQHICDYIGDFEYREGDAIVVEDAKGYKTDVYKIKKRIFHIVHGFPITEV